ncbi:MAG TPA: hypothetical protein DCP69_09480 [Candidatus Omnitrophica bacterium]|nr:hypothetical protein [Candidatus Omnitrophota bacterium]
MAYEDWAATLKTKVGELTGLTGGARDYTDLPATLQEFPVAIILPNDGDLDYSSGGPNIEMTRIKITIYTAGSILPEAMSICVPFLALVRNKFAAELTLDGLVEYILPTKPWFSGPGVLRYGDKEGLIGIVFNYLVKENVSGDFTVQV